MPSKRTSRKELDPRLVDYSKDGKYFYDEEEADRWVNFFPLFLTHTVGEWAGNEMALDEWQEFQIIRPLFGWKSVETGLRRFRVLWLEIPRKNGKSKIASGLGIGLSTIDKEPGAQVYCAAEDKDQAKIVFNDAKLMVLANRELKKRCQVLKESIYIPSTNSIMRVLSSVPDSKHGLNPNGVIIDEVHVQPNSELIDVLTTGMGARRQPITAYITTAGFDKTTICGQLHDRAVKIRDGIIEDDTWLVCIYAADPEKDNWEDEEVWARVNPGFGISIKPEFLRSEYLKAKESPAFENTFKRLYLNIWTAQNTRWLPMDKYDACGRDFEEADLVGKQCFGGLDLATVNDLAAFVMLFPEWDEDEGPLYRALPYFFIPEDNIEQRVKKSGVPYDVWKRQGLIETTPGDCIDYEYIRKRINELSKKFKIQQIGYDPFNAYEITHKLATEDGFDMIEVRQGFLTMSPPTKRLMTLVLRQRFLHNKHAVLRWNADNATVIQDTKENLMLSKAKSVEKIDGLVAATIALSCAMVAPPPKPKIRIEYI